MQITIEALKEQIIKDSKTFKAFVNKVYLNEMVQIIKCRVGTYQKILLGELPFETQLHIIGFMRDFIYSGINENELKKKISKCLK